MTNQWGKGMKDRSFTVKMHGSGGMSGVNCVDGLIKFLVAMDNNKDSSCVKSSEYHDLLAPRELAV